MKTRAAALFAVLSSASLADASDVKPKADRRAEIGARYARETKDGDSAGRREQKKRASRALEEDGGVLGDEISMAALHRPGGGPYTSPPMRMDDPKSCPAPDMPAGWNPEWATHPHEWGPPEWGPPPNEWESPPPHGDVPPPGWTPWNRRMKWKSKSKTSKKHKGPWGGAKSEEPETCAPVGAACDGYSHYKIGVLGLSGGSDCQGTPVCYPDGSWTDFAMLAGTDHEYAFPGYDYFGGTSGTLEGCVLAPVPSKDELQNLWIEVQRLIVAAVGSAGSGNEGGAEFFLENRALWLGVVKSSLDVFTDNGGNGSRANWVNLDGTPADVCDAQLWAGAGTPEEQPDNDGEPPVLETRLALFQGFLKDAADLPRIRAAVYRCCAGTIAFSSCGATA